MLTNVAAWAGAAPAAAAAPPASRTYQREIMDVSPIFDSIEWAYMPAKGSIGNKCVGMPMKLPV